MGIELLIVDDDQILQVILKKMFEKVNPTLKIATFNNGHEALTYLKSISGGPTPSILVDIYLNDMNGWDFLEEIEGDERFVSKVYLITSSVRSQNTVDSQRYKSVAGFFTKPITYEDIKAINALI